MILLRIALLAGLGYLIWSVWRIMRSRHAEVGKSAGELRAPKIERCDADNGEENKP